MRCFKCGNTLPDDSLFCQFCGANLNEQNVCTACGAPMEEGGSFCSHCGQQRENVAAPVKRKNASTALRIAAILLPIAILIAALIFLIKPLSSLQLPEKAKPASFSPAEAARSVLYLECYDSTGDLLGTGSGFLANDGKTLVTNHHVIQGAYTITAFDANGEYAADALQILHDNIRMDLAVLELNRDTGLSPLPFGDSEPLKQGDHVYAIGYPLGKSNTVSDGIISSLYENDHVDILQITAPVSPGSSGGVLLDPLGKIVGVIYAGYENGQNMNLAVAVNELKNLMTYFNKPISPEDLYLQTHPQLEYDNYEVRLTFLQTPTSEIAEEFHADWRNTDRTELALQVLLDKYLAFYGCTYYEDLDFFAPGYLVNNDYEEWVFDIDRSFGDMLLLNDDEHIYLGIFYEVREVKTEAPATEAPAEEAPAEEIPAEAPEETPVEEAPVETPVEEAPVEEDPEGCTHIWSTWAVKQPEGCTTDGYTIACCSLCRSTERRPLPAKGHTAVTDLAGTPATCTEGGKQSKSHCAVCEAVLSDGGAVAPLGHSFKNGTCSRCGEEDPNYVPPKAEAPAETPAETPTETPAETKTLTIEDLQGTWYSQELDGIYGRKQQYTFNGNTFYWKFWSGGMTSGNDAIEDKRNGTFTIEGNTVYFSDGTVGTFIDNHLYIGSLVFFNPYK